MEFHGQFSDADICLSVVVAAQDDVGADDWMKAISLVVSGFEGVRVLFCVLSFILVLRYRHLTSHRY